MAWTVSGSFVSSSSSRTKNWAFKSDGTIFWNADAFGPTWTVGIPRSGKLATVKDKRAEYGQKIFQTLSGKLTTEYGRGFGLQNLFNMVRFAEAFPNAKIVQTLSAQLGWSHFVELISMTDPLKRDFYAEMCRLERWSVRALREKIGGMLYERTALSKKPAKDAELYEFLPAVYLYDARVLADPAWVEKLKTAPEEPAPANDGSLPA
ncbi:MAG: hypothetical protein HY554_15470 [Elusimicrobia bacterium]|nr:hypothetical protein [Elusimicrobiota bacterium]